MVETHQFLVSDENASGNERSVDRSVPEVEEIDPVSATEILDWFLRWKEKVRNDDDNASRVDMRDNVKTSDCMESKISNCAQDYFSSRSTVVPHELDTVRRVFFFVFPRINIFLRELLNSSMYLYIIWIKNN